MVDVGMDVAVAQKADEMKLLPILGSIEKPVPRLTLENGTRFHGFLDETCALRKDASCTDRIVTDFAVAHIGIRRHPDVRPVRKQKRLLCHLVEHVKYRCPCQIHGITLILAAFANAVKNNNKHRTLRTLHVTFL